MKEKISVLIPTYNVEKFVEQALRSVMNQTYSNLEIIIVDDCSTDNTYEILTKIAEEDDRIKLLRNETNLKIAETLNLALKQSTGKYIVRMDGDDISHPERINILYIFLKNNPDIKLVGSNYSFIDEENNSIKKEVLQPETFQTIKKVAMYSSPVLHIWMTYRDIYTKYGNYRMAGVEDYDFVLRLISNNVKLANIQKNIYSVRLRDGNTISSMGLLQRKAFNYTKKLYRERILSNSNKDSYSLKNYQNAIKSTRFENKMYQKSAIMYKKFILRSKREGIVYLLLAILFSPYYQLQYLINRALYRIYNK
ncbi:glycosyltransferase family 2 protein [Capnocytophaga cynodegmi]|uniref:glycosyltransferase family 2 protein n=1 Tax=Capnocytophaga cynodegmi TaxID=28189 RepID=UPI00385A0E24